MLGRMAGSADGSEPAAMEAAAEDMMKQLMADYEKMGEKEDFQSVVDNMMRQLLSKDIMYTPMKLICEKVRRRRSPIAYCRCCCCRRRRCA
jgi:peroxin-19